MPRHALASLRKQRTASPARTSGDHSAVAPPVPIPNTEVKRCSPDGSATIGCARVGRRQNKDPAPVKAAGFLLYATGTATRTDKASPAGFFECKVMKTTQLALLLAAVLAVTTTANAASSKTYQVTGPVLEVNESMIAVQKGKERWEIARDSSSKADGEVKVGDKVTVTYRMTATKIEGKGGGNGDAKTAPSPSGEKK